jgi:transcriptional regulator GlxA family with amidase domain
MIRNVAILIFDDVEVLDFCGPFEVFSVAGIQEGYSPFRVFTVSEEQRPIRARNNLSVNPHFTLSNCPRPDILLIPGGMGTRKEMYNPAILNWIKQMASEVELVLSVCTGVLILAKAGLLKGLSATTHHGAFSLLEEIAPDAIIEKSRRFIDNGRIVIAAGISAGIDMCLYVVGRLLGNDLAQKTADYMEYNWKAGGV